LELRQLAGVPPLQQQYNSKAVVLDGFDSSPVLQHTQHMICAVKWQMQTKAAPDMVKHLIYGQTLTP